MLPSPAWAKGRLGDNSTEVGSNVFQVIVADTVYLIKFLLYGQTGKNMSVKLEQKKGESFYTKIPLEANITLKYNRVFFCQWAQFCIIKQTEIKYL